jgi:MoaA/NifB/PqqE/SkfB family radical SAM enzyme
MQFEYYPPKFLFLTINEVCNLNCLHCNYWRTKQPSLEVTSLSRQTEILSEFAELSPSGSVVICGGEPLLDVHSYFHVCSTARTLGLKTLSVINGTLITNERDADKLIAEGPDEITVSLDGHTPELHDLMRGRKGAFQQATNAISLLLASRKATGKKIYAMGLVYKASYQYLDEFYNLVLNQLGADKLKLNAIQPTFLHIRLGQQQNDTFFAAESQVNADWLEEILSRCESKYGLSYNPNWKRQFVGYFRNLYGRPNLNLGWSCGVTTDEHICNSPDRNIMVDLVGNASLCFSNAFPRALLSKPGDLRAFWEENNDLKARMRQCNNLCGISHSVKREPATRSGRDLIPIVGD